MIGQDKYICSKCFQGFGNNKQRRNKHEKGRNCNRRTEFYILEKKLYEWATRGPASPYPPIDLLDDVSA